jgi:RNA polymerase sigma factor (sigma-70 family)
LLAAHRGSLQRLARRISLCEADADDALQRATVILLTRPPERTDRIAAWMHVVTRREALAVRRERERLLGAPLGESLPGASPCPSERAERRDRMRLLAELKPDQRRALLLRACGYSYVEIRELTGWTHTKVNRCLAEGRARLRSLSALE